MKLTTIHGDDFLKFPSQKNANSLSCSSNCNLLFFTSIFLKISIGVFSSQHFFSTVETETKTISMDYDPIMFHFSATINYLLVN